MKIKTEQNDNIHRRSNRDTHTEAERDRDRHRHRQTKTGNEADRQTDKQTNRPVNKQTTQTYRMQTSTYKKKYKKNKKDSYPADPRASTASPLPLFATGTTSIWSSDDINQSVTCHFFVGQNQQNMQ